jgi:hypothetical protein
MSAHKTPINPAPAIKPDAAESLNISACCGRRMLHTRPTTAPVKKTQDCKLHQFCGTDVCVSDELRKSQIVLNHAAWGHLIWKNDERQADAGTTGYISVLQMRPNRETVITCPDTHPAKRDHRWLRRKNTLRHGRAIPKMTMKMMLIQQRSGSAENPLFRTWATCIGALLDVNVALTSQIQDGSKKEIQLNNHRVVVEAYFSGFHVYLHP